jgi:hypothetical protein
MHLPPWLVVQLLFVGAVALECAVLVWRYRRRTRRREEECRVVPMLHGLRTRCGRRPDAD